MIGIEVCAAYIVFAFGCDAPRQGRSENA